MVVRQTLADEVLAPVRDLGTRGERNLTGVQDGLVLQYHLLRLIVAKGLLAKDKLEEDYTYGPNVNLVRYLGRIGLEALGCLVPVSANSLTSQLNLFVSFVDYLAETKVSDFDFAVVEDNVLRFQIVVDDLFVLVVQVLQATQNL